MVISSLSESVAKKDKGNNPEKSLGTNTRREGEGTTGLALTRTATTTEGDFPLVTVSTTAYETEAYALLAASDCPYKSFPPMSGKNSTRPSGSATPHAFSQSESASQLSTSSSTPCSPSGVT